MSMPNTIDKIMIANVSFSEESRKTRAEILIEKFRCIQDGYEYGYQIAKDDTHPCGDCPCREDCTPSLNLLCVYAQAFFNDKCVREHMIIHQIQLVKIK